MFSKSCKYALRAVLYLAANTNESKKAGAKVIAETLDVPRPFLSKILQQLSRHQLIASTKGPHGGFYLDEREKKTAHLQDDGRQSLEGGVGAGDEMTHPDSCGEDLRMGKWDNIGFTRIY